MSVSPNSDLLEPFVELGLADFMFYYFSVVALIMGLEIFSRSISTKVNSQPGLPTAQFTVFDKVILGSYTR